MSESFEQTTVGEVVAADFRAGGVFEQFGIDFCCGGRRSIAEACRTASVDPAAVRLALEALPADDGSDSGDVTRWPVDRLIEHIVEMHHGYVRAALPIIGRYLAKLVEVHGTRHPELSRVAAAFDRMGRDLWQHMLKEERVLFPYVRELAAARGGVSIRSPFGTVENPIRMMEREHREAGDEMRLVRELTNGYTPPSDGCTTYRVAFEELARFERDLHRHVHLENNVLFPKAVALERNLPPE
ncbi:MAG TPA: iron-sulfur cluster repair di-iron protein [Vicinamibacterales bacterium]|jgi:regulator of cell morphogenesis and NO signaling|nr:iron-sulfur cluster repair di-iron protein [Vicinamibacterales bacterium]